MFKLGDRVVVVSCENSAKVGQMGTIASHRSDRNGWWRVTGIPGSLNFRTDQLRKA